MVSEDSQELRWLPVTHRLRNRGDLRQPFKGQVSTFLHLFDDGRELLEVSSLGGTELMLTKERNDPFQEVVSPVHRVPQEILLVVITATVSIDPSALEEINEIVQDLSTGSSLDNGESRLDLPAEGHLWALHDGCTEAPFSVDEAQDPSNVPESFLLIFRRDALYVTRHRIVTAHNSSIPVG